MRHEPRRALLPCLLLLPCLAHAAGAAGSQGRALDAGAGPAAAAASDPKPERVRTRLLHLRGGDVLRARSRWNGEAWEVRSGRGWSALPPSAVERVALERDVLAEARRRERAIPGAAPVETRLAHLAWLRGEGLYEECLEGLDAILRREPDQPEALAFVRDSDLPLALPPFPSGGAADSSGDEAGRERFFRVAAGLSPAGREIAVRELLGAENPIALRRALESELLAGTPRRRSFAAQALRRLFPGQATDGLVSRAILDASGDVRTSAALALKAAADPSLAEPFLGALESPHPAVRANAAEALGTLGVPRAVPPLVARLSALQGSGGGRSHGSHIFVGRQRAYLQGFDVEVAQAESIADPEVGTLVEGSVLDVRVLGASTFSTAYESVTLRRALHTLTGASPGHTCAAWQRWWEEEGEAWLAATRAAAPGSLPGETAAAARR